jgi:hypothetical protein
LEWLIAISDILFRRDTGSFFNLRSLRRGVRSEMNPNTETSTVTILTSKLENWGFKCKFRFLYFSTFLNLAALRLVSWHTVSSKTVMRLGERMAKSGLRLLKRLQMGLLLGRSTYRVKEEGNTELM